MAETKLREVADGLRSNWSQGIEGDNCLLQHIARAHGLIHWSYVHLADGDAGADFRAVMNVIGEQYPLYAPHYSYFRGFLFNDARDRVQDEVVRVAEKAAVRREEEI